MRNTTCSRSFSYLLNREGYSELKLRAGEGLTAIWGSRIGCLQPGDTVFPIAIHQRNVHVLCRFDVKEVHVDARKAVGESSPIRIDAFLQPRAAACLRFVQGRESRGPVLRGELLDPQTLRGIRQLTAESALMLTSCLQAAQRRGPVEQASGTRMRALSIRQPWAELILLGFKSIEVRTRPTNVRERFYIYASPIRAERQLEDAVRKEFNVASDALTRGALVGSVELVGCRALRPTDYRAACIRPSTCERLYAWLLDRPIRFEQPLKPACRAQPVWFYPY